MKVALFITLVLLITSRAQLQAQPNALDCAISSITTTEKVLAFTKTILEDVKKNATTTDYVQRALEFVLAEGMQVLYNLKQCGVIETVPDFTQTEAAVCANEVLKVWGEVAEGFGELYEGHFDITKLMMRVMQIPYIKQNLSEKCKF